MKAQQIPVFIAFALSSSVFAQTLDKKIEEVCGTHPVLIHLEQFKVSLIDPQFLVEAEECAQGDAALDLWKWKLTDTKIKGCLIKKYGYQSKYVDGISKHFEEAKEDVSTQIEPFNSCANNVRKCGQVDCTPPPPPTPEFMQSKWKNRSGQHRLGVDS